MSKLNSEVISRRKALSLLRLATLGLTVPATVLTESDAKAQQPAPGTAPSTAPVTGTGLGNADRVAPFLQTWIPTPVTGTKITMESPSAATECVVCDTPVVRI